MASNYSLKRTLGGLRDSVTGYLNGYAMDLGLEFYTTAVATLGNLKDPYFYPNPSNGLFTAGFEARGGIKTARLSVWSITGQMVWKEEFRDIPASALFAENVDIRSSPKGIYILRIDADGQVLNRRLQVE